MDTQTTITTAARVRDCQVKMVSRKGMTPVIGSRDGGRLSALAWS